MNLDWRISSECNGGSCVRAAISGRSVSLGSTERRQPAILVFPTDDWILFTGAVKAGNYSGPPEQVVNVPSRIDDKSANGGYTPSAPVVPCEHLAVDLQGATVMSRESTDEDVWRRACNNGGCVEVAFADDAVRVRDGKHGGESAVLDFTWDEWRDFLAGVRRGEFDAK
ncbi:DUF397 domain-containing protein [Herbidospora sp. RD11066]